MRRVLMDSVERLRKAARNEVPAVLEVLRRHTVDLAQVPFSTNRLRERGDCMTIPIERTMITEV